LTSREWRQLKNILCTFQGRTLCGGLMVRVFASNPKVKGSNLMGGVVCGQQWYVD